MDETTMDYWIERLQSQHKIIEWGVLSGLRELEQDLTKMGWDQPHRLFSFHRYMAPPEVVQADESVGDAFVLGVNEVPDLPLKDGDGRQLAFVLYWAAEMCRKEPDRSHFEDLLAWMLVIEGYMVIADDTDEKTERMARAHRLNEHPERQEVRELLAIDRAGIAYSVVRVRNGELRVSVAEPGNHEFEQQGRLTDGLRALMEACA